MLARSLLYMQPVEGRRDEVIALFERLGVADRALQQDGCLSVELQVAPEAGAPLLVTALWADRSAYDGWLANPWRETVTPSSRPCSPSPRRDVYDIRLHAGSTLRVSRYRVSMDIGGTFTDVVAYDEQAGTYAAGKASTTPADLTEGVLAGLEQVVASPGDIAFTVHGTTQGLNAFLQRRGERVLLLATRGAGDVYHIARGNRTRLYDLHYRKPEPLLPRARHRRDRRPARLRRAPSSSRSTTTPCGPPRGAPATRVRRDRGRVPVLLRQPRARAARRRRSCARSSTASRSRCRTASRASGASTSAPPRPSIDAYTAPIVRRYLERLEPSCARAGCPSAARHAVQRRHRDRRVGARAHAADAAVRPGRRHDGRRRAGAPARPPEPDLHRHGRDELRRLARRRRRSPTCRPRRSSRASRCSCRW